MNDNQNHARLHDAMKASQEELIDLHRRLVAVPSVNFGDGSDAHEDQAAKVAADYLAGFGIDSRVAQGSPGRANLMASLGESPADEPGTLLFMGHSDVVPVGDPATWRFPPFSAEIAEGRIWGRGSNDCKMLVAAQLFAMGALARLGLPGQGQLRLALCADEEAGGRWGFGWLAENEPEFLRADLAINEGGGAYLGPSHSGHPMFTVGCGDKGRYEVIFTARGPGAHASVPWGKTNPLAEVGRLADRAQRWEGPISLSSPIFEGLRSWLGLEGDASRENLTETIDRGREFSVSFGNSLMAQSRMTLAPTMASAGEKSNAVPATAELRCDARTLPGQTQADLEKALEGIRGEFPEIEMRIEETAAPSGSAFTPEAASLFARALERTLGENSAAARTGASTPGGPPRVAPTWCTGFTDSRFVRRLGTPTYGFQLIEPGADPDRLSIHCVDESIEVGMLLPCALSLAHLALDFCHNPFSVAASGAA